MPIGNQSVLLRNVNDNAQVTIAHTSPVDDARAPLLPAQCDLITGSAHLRADPRKGIESSENYVATQQPLDPAIRDRCPWWRQDSNQS